VSVSLDDESDLGWGRRGGGGSPEKILDGGTLGRRRADDRSGDRWSLAGLVAPWSTEAQQQSSGWRKGASPVAEGIAQWCGP
jgi:hypothetical protein